MDRFPFSSASFTGNPEDGQLLRARVGIHNVGHLGSLGEKPNVQPKAAMAIFENTWPSSKMAKTMHFLATLDVLKDLPIDKSYFSTQDGQIFKHIRAREEKRARRLIAKGK